jgi:hypothetical protein
MIPARLILAAVLTTLACASAPGTERASGARGDSRTITAADLSKASQLNLYDYVQATHPRWLVSVGGARSFPVVVFVDETQLGPPETLRNIGLADVRVVRYYDASAAQSRFNRVGMGPVIQVVMH